MNFLTILKNLYTNKHCDWIKTIDDSLIQPYVIQRWLVMNDRIRTQTRWLDKYVFGLPPKMYLSLAWSIIPKTPKMPFVKYIKKLQDEEEFNFILPLIRKQFKLADNDFNSVKYNLIKAIKDDMVNWFCYYGIQKRYWHKYKIDFRLIKDYGDKKVDAQKGLDAWGL